MTVNQLFRKVPDKEFIEALLLEIGLESITDTRTFSRMEIEASKLPEIIEKSLDKFREFYLPCKFDIYFTELTSKKIVTILRQCLKPLNVTINSCEKCINGDKMLVYKLKPFSPKGKISKSNKGMIFFD
jgi:hypothetical protein